jgi:hypothetical protein
VVVAKTSSPDIRQSCTSFCSTPRCLNRARPCLSSLPLKQRHQNRCGLWQDWARPPSLFTAICLNSRSYGIRICCIFIVRYVHFYNAWTRVCPVLQSSPLYSTDESQPEEYCKLLEEINDRLSPKADCGEYELEKMQTQGETDLQESFHL